MLFVLLLQAVLPIEYRRNWIAEAFLRLERRQMTGKKCDEVPVFEKCDIKYLAIILSAALVIGTYLVATCTLIAKDGIFYIERARQFAEDPMFVIRVHPFGYPVLIHACHKVLSFFQIPESTAGWIHCGQFISLFCRIASLIPLYFLGKMLVGSKKSFWAMLILVMLPLPAEWASDVLRDWPYILFLATGLFLLFYALRRNAWWLFVFMGLTVGLGCTIRPEMIQLVFYTFLGVLFLFLKKSPNADRRKTAVNFLVFMFAFSIPAVPYSAVRGNFLGRKVEQIFSYWQTGTAEGAGMIDAGIEEQIDKSDAPRSGTRLLRAGGRLIEGMAEILMYFFAAGLVLGIWDRIRKRKMTNNTERWFVPVFVVVNTALLVFLYYYYGYMSTRHFLGLTVVLIFYVPAGMESLASFLAGVKDGEKALTKELAKRRKICFLILMMIGAAICLVKLSKPIRHDKVGYREAASWLKENTPAGSVIDDEGIRISFYADRQRLQLLQQDSVPTNLYSVRFVKEKDLKDFEFNGELIKTFEYGKKNEKRILIIKSR